MLVNMKRSMLVTSRGPKIRGGQSQEYAKAKNRFGPRGGKVQEEAKIESFLKSREVQDQKRVKVEGRMRILGN